MVDLVEDGRDILIKLKSNIQECLLNTSSLVKTVILELLQITF